MKPNSFEPSLAHPGEAIIEAETERLLSGRTRNIRLSGDMLRLYQDTSWPQRSKIVRAWTIWVTLINFAFLPISYLLVPEVLPRSLEIGIFFFPAAHACLYLIWRKQRAAWIEGLSVVVIVVVFVGTFGSVGAAAHGANGERFLTGSMYFAAIAIVVLDVDLKWSASIGVCTMILYFGFQIYNPEIEFRTAIATTLYYAMGMFSVVVARRTAIILSHKSFLMALRDRYRRKALTKANGLLATLATRDPLTGLANRRSASDSIAAIWRNPAIEKSRVALIMADIDHFKKLNDTAGHTAGDDCIFRVARSIEASVRTDDVVCRYGGEEFLIVLTDVTPALAWTLAERIRSDVEAMAIVNPGLDPRDAPAGHVTISLGVAFARDFADPEWVVKWADEALYDAKHAGRNRVFLSFADNVDLAHTANDRPPTWSPVAGRTEAPPKVL